jgi:hypothetical protein
VVGRAAVFSGIYTVTGFCSLERFPNTIPSRMTTPATPSSPQPAGDDRKLVSVDESYIAPTFEDKLNLFWQKNSTTVWIICGLVVVAILAKGGWDYMQRQKELDVQKAYAAASTSDQLKAFAAANPEHALAGIAQLRLADEAYAAGKSADAIAAYEKVAATLKTGPLAARAQFGRAAAKLQGGKAADAAVDLKQIAADTTQSNAIRTHAMYALASLAAEASDGAEVQKYADQLMQLDPASPWSRNVMTLRAKVPAPAAPAAPAKTDAAPANGVQVKIPGK